MRIDVDQMIKKTKGVKTIPDLAEFLNTKGVEVSGRTLYRWIKGIGFNKSKVIAAAKAVGIELRDVVIL